MKGKEECRRQWSSCPLRWVKNALEFCPLILVPKCILGAHSWKHSTTAGTFECERAHIDSEQKCICALPSHIKTISNFLKLKAGGEKKEEVEGEWTGNSWHFLPLILNSSVLFPCYPPGLESPYETCHNLYLSAQANEKPPNMFQTAGL